MYAKNMYVITKSYCDGKTMIESANLAFIFKESRNNVMKISNFKKAVELHLLQGHTLWNCVTFSYGQIE